MKKAMPSLEDAPRWPSSQIESEGGPTTLDKDTVLVLYLPLPLPLIPGELA
jgi:hypothetical protein